MPIQAVEELGFFVPVPGAPQMAVIALDMFTKGEASKVSLRSENMSNRPSLTLPFQKSFFLKPSVSSETKNPVSALH